jgi:hypothetical protein
VPATNATKSLSCKNLVGRYGSGMGFCNADSEQLPLPSATFVSRMYVCIALVYFDFFLCLLCCLN